MQYNDARKTVARWLRQHATEFPARPQIGYAEIDGQLPRSSEPRWRKLFVALNFWDGWIDASNHGWQYHEPIAAQDWPMLAQEIAANLEADQEITHPVILSAFSLRD